jgi:hypothetical protein
MVFGDRLQVTAGIHTSADGGLRLYRLDPSTGAPEARERIGSDRLWSFDTTSFADYSAFGTRNGFVNDILTANYGGRLLFLHNVAIEPATLAWASLSGGAARGGNGVGAVVEGNERQLGGDCDGVASEPPEDELDRVVVGGDDCGGAGVKLPRPRPLCTMTITGGSTGARAPAATAGGGPANQRFPAL